MQHINVKGYANTLLDLIAREPKRGKLCILTLGDNPASASYVKGKIKDCERCGIKYEHRKVSSEMELGITINMYNCDESVAGIIVQLPLPEGIDATLYTNAVRTDKDVDGFKDNSPFEPCTPEGIMRLLRWELDGLAGKRALVIGRGELVGIPIAARLLAADCTVTIAHSKTTNLDELLASSDIIIAAAGKPGLVDLMKCRSAEIVIDAGVNRDANGKLCGDCYNFSEDALPNLKVTPVPGGVGLMTRAMLMQHMSMHRFTN